MFGTENRFNSQYLFTLSSSSFEATLQCTNGDTNSFCSKRIQNQSDEVALESRMMNNLNTCVCCLQESESDKIRDSGFMETISLSSHLNNLSYEDWTLPNSLANNSVDGATPPPVPPKGGIAPPLASVAMAAIDIGIRAYFIYTSLFYVYCEVTLLCSRSKGRNENERQLLHLVELKGPSN